MRTYRFTVQGYGQFPLDMLRYDACWPDTGYDVAEIHASFDPKMRTERARAKTPFKVTLSSGIMTPTAERWASFLWKVVGVCVG